MMFDKLWRVAILVSLVAVAIALFSNTSPRVTAQAGPPAAPTRVATVDLVELINGLHEYKARNDAAISFSSTLRDEMESKREAAKSAQEDLEAATDATRQSLERAAVQSIAEFEAAQVSYRVLSTAQLNRNLRSTWADVREAIAEYAEQNSYEIVISDDRLAEANIPLDANPDAFQAFMMERRILHAANAVDITDEIITRMNNDYNAALANPSR